MTSLDRAVRYTLRPVVAAAALALGACAVAQDAASAGPPPPQASAALRPIAVPARPEGAVLDLFQYDTAFVKQSTAGSAESVLDDVLIGTRSLRATTDGDGKQVNLRATNVGPFDLGGAFLRLDLKLRGVAALDYLLVYLSTDGFETYDAFPVLGGQRPSEETYAEDDEWFTITANLGTTVAGGPPTIDLGQVTDIQLSLRDSGAGPVTVWYAALEAVAAPARGLVSIVFDDARDGVFYYALPLARRLGVPASIAAIVDLVGEPSFMTVEQLRVAERFGGWEVIAHHTTPLEEGGFDTLSPKDLDLELAGVKGWLLANGFRHGADVIAYPYGGFDDASLEQVRGYFAAGRTIMRTQGLETFPPADPYRVRAISVVPGDGPGVVKALIDRAARERAWLVLVFHQVAPSGSGYDTYYAAEDLASIFGYLRVADVDTVLFSDALFGR
ncbi:MAG: polysaccharide deacetylase family protein [Trueperaceae bacterium]|nr:polysaccharide deacetylase family protein [Trueperaceae bacterium]MCO5174584.1 hypothetical protein [Trueperaceae bacterium]MCW5820143.1 polysaccharide deacetylase family protein [Trueperaceae bacterium]